MPLQSKRFHIIIDVLGIDNKLLADKELIGNFLNQFPSKIGMSVLNPPVVIEGIEENPGVTGFVIIDYSHISMHTFTKYQEVLVDIFSCKPYSQEKAQQEVLDLFQVDKSQARIKQVHWDEAI